MKHGSTLFLRLSILAIGAAVLALCVFALPAMWVAVDKEFHRQDVINAVYGILAAMYVSALPFFIALYQGWKILNCIDRNTAFSLSSVRAFKNIKYCALVISAVYALSLPLFYIWAQYDDAPGLVVIGMVLVGAPLVVGVFAAVMQKVFQNALDIKHENDLTV